MKQETRRQLTNQEWQAEAKAKYGDNPLKWEFKCPNCGHVHTLQDWKDLGLSEDDCMGYLAYSCLGRKVKGVGCDWSLGGLFQLHTLEVETPQGYRPTFEFSK